jgi:hypothetical protein
MSSLSRQTYANLAAVVFGAAAVHQLVNVIAKHPDMELVSGASRAVAAVNVALFAAASITLFLRKRAPAIVTASWTLGVFGILGLLLEGSLLAPLGAPVMGVIYVVAAALTTFLFKRAFDRGLLRHGRDLDVRLV